MQNKKNPEKKNATCENEEKTKGGSGQSGELA